MALMSDEEVDDILERSVLEPVTPKTLTDPDAIRAKVAEARRDGFASATEQSLLGEVAIAVAIRDHEGRPRGAIHIAGSLSEWTEEEFRRRFAPLGMEAAAAIGG